MKIVYMGTPDFAVNPLHALAEAGYEVTGVVTQPDKPKGRGKSMLPTPVKEEALKHGFPVYQPVKVRDPEFLQVLEKLDPDIIVVAAFGQIIPKSILELPKYGCINIHASLLPKYRGAAPIQQAVIDGEKESGVTIMRMGTGLDTGDIILQSEFALSDEITAGELHDIMMEQGGELLVETIDKIKNNCAPRIPQNDEESSYAPMMNKALGNIDFSKTAKEIHNLVRGVNPWPSAYTTYEGKSMKVWKTKVLNETTSKECGTILKVDKDGIRVATKDKILLIEEIQMPNKKRVAVCEYIKGNKIEEDTILG